MSCGGGGICAIIIDDECGELWGNRRLGETRGT